MEQLISAIGGGDRRSLSIRPRVGDLVQGTYLEVADGSVERIVAEPALFVQEFARFAIWRWTE